jgi:hypothetical protein
VAEIIKVSDLPTALQSAELVATMVAGANAKASRVAPCLTWEDEDEDHPEPTEEQLAEAKLVLIGAVKRWVEAGTGAFQQQTAGPFGVTVDTRQRTGYNLWPSEIEGLQEICMDADAEGTGAFEVDTMPASAGVYGVDYWWTGPDTTSTVF